MSDVEAREEIRDGMHITWHAPIAMDDGIVLRADIYRPIETGTYPAILTYGPYGKGVSYQEGYPLQWQKMVADYPEILEGSTNKYQNWETADPERWVPHGYAVIRVDSRGAGWSPGFLEVFAPREDDDIYECIGWTADQPWCSGKVGMLGISYYAINQWKVAERNHPNLAAIIPWEGNNDRYRDEYYHGGILSQFTEKWARYQLVNVQYGRGDKAAVNPNTGESAAGPITLSDQELACNRTNSFEQVKAHPLEDDWHLSRKTDLSKVKVPFLTCANWGGQGLHPRGSYTAFMEAASEEKWLEVHGDSHWSLFSSGYGLDLQKRFFDHYLKDVDNGWEQTPPVMLNIRRPGPKFARRDESEWPIARTNWTKFYLDPENMTLSTEPARNDCAVEYDAMGDGATFWTEPLDAEMEITGPMAARLFVSSSTSDADLFLIVRVFDPEGDELTFMGSTDPNTPIANGWLRVSHRAIDPERSLSYRPYHPHTHVEPLSPGEVYECDVEIVPSCIVVPPGWRVALTVRGKDYEYEGELGDFAKTFHYATRGTGNMTHNDPDSRPKEIFGGQVTLTSAPGKEPYLLLPVIPSR